MTEDQLWYYSERGSAVCCTSWRLVRFRSTPLRSLWVASRSCDRKRLWLVVLLRFLLCEPPVNIILTPWCEMPPLFCLPWPSTKCLGQGFQLDSIREMNGRGNPLLLIQPMVHRDTWLLVIEPLVSRCRFSLHWAGAALPLENTLLHWLHQDQEKKTEMGIFHWRNTSARPLI